MPGQTLREPSLIAAAGSGARATPAVTGASSTAGDTSSDVPTDQEVDRG